ncbi:hypothetical protein PV04_07674 [Phialophora macrospora]|uniref:Fe2OG dioxygenase domain-containing protein n=1 Tax=Phialophora macrospora TaxID=1851006 RepID=A0A0D2CJJ5_9EURO|nr:hypothetical protein PV04_07674 [Phialophora macrospora]
MAAPYVPCISLKDFESRKDEITAQLIDATENSGFLTLIDHGLSLSEIQTQFATSQAFFSLPMDVKGKTAYEMEKLLGWEYFAQRRPLTGVEQKESLWLTLGSKWPSDEDVPSFRANTENFIRKCQKISDQLLECLANALGFPSQYFKDPMDISKPDTLSRLRLLHYPASENAVGTWRAGSHTDVGCLTLLFQQDGGDGLEICPGRESSTSAAMGDTFYPLPAKTGPIVVNIGDMLMSWSDDRLKATHHRVRANDVGKSPSRYSIAFFNQGREDFVFQGPKKKYPPITCGGYIHSYTQRQFGGPQAPSSAEQIDQSSLITVKN